MHATIFYWAPNARLTAVGLGVIEFAVKELGNFQRHLCDLLSASSHTQNEKDEWTVANVNGVFLI
jgi:hypothetical protein